MVVFGFYIKIGLVGLLNVSGAGLLNPSIDILIDVPKIASYIDSSQASFRAV
jgi:hypothetical protein